MALSGSTDFMVLNIILGF